MLDILKIYFKKNAVKNFEMKLTLKIKLLPNATQRVSLLNTLKEANTQCNVISNVAWEKKVFNQFKLHKECYCKIRETSKLSAQLVVRCISKVSDAYKIDKKVKRLFNDYGAIAYDSRILSYKNNQVSIWSVGGRLKMPFKCHNEKYLPYIKGEADLVFKNDKFFLFQTVEIPEEYIDDVEGFIGIDFGINKLACASNGYEYDGKQLKKYKDKKRKVRASIQAKNTRSSHRLLKRLSGRENRHNTMINHTISKKLVNLAKQENKGLVIEDLKGVRKAKTNKTTRTLVANWSFYQLREMLEYKAKLQGVKLIVVSAKYSSKSCNVCNKIGVRNGAKFSCSCGFEGCADGNASKVLRKLGVCVNNPDKSAELLVCAI